MGQARDPPFFLGGGVGKGGRTGFCMCVFLWLKVIFGGAGGVFCFVFHFLFVLKGSVFITLCFCSSLISIAVDCPELGRIIRLR